MFVVDFLHEVELGVWKALFTHLIHILYAINPDAVGTLNSRYVPTNKGKFWIYSDWHICNIDTEK